MKRKLFLLLTIVSVGACTAPTETSQPSTAKPVTAHKLTTQSRYPTVVISEYTLITGDLEGQKAEAAAIMQAKTEWPRAMQTKVAADFDKILARNFTLHDPFFALNAPAGLMSRHAYLAERLGDTTKVRTAIYDNLVLQIFPQRAILTYHNIVEDEPGGPTAWKGGMAWMDIFVKEDNQWKIESSRMIHLDMLNDPDKQP